jgi:hypothetical protein
MRFLLELDPNVVKPGWTPLLILLGLGLVMVLLFRSMRRQFRRVHDNFPEPAAPVGLAPAEDEVGPADPQTTAASGEDADGPTPDGRPASTRG